MVERRVEVPLDLSGVQVDRDDAVGAGHRQHVGDELGADRLARERLVILPGVAVVRDHRGDALGGRPLHGVDHDQLLHDRFVHRLVVRLHDEAIGAAHALLRSEVQLGVREPPDLGFAQRDPEAIRDLVAQVRMDGAGEQHHPLLRDDLHRAPLSSRPCPCGGAPRPCVRGTPRRCAARLARRPARPPARPS